MAVLQDVGRIKVARLVATQPIYLAWGRGRPAWDAAGPEPETTKHTGLISEIGRTIATSVQYAVPDDAGPIELPDRSRYAISAAPTQWLYVRWDFSYDDAAGETVRELGVFLGGTVAAGLPAGQRYFPAAQVTSPGDLYTMEHLAEPFKRAGNTLEGQDFILPF
ncbi:hypothetical protein [Paracidovorax konjaci]|uniref:Uncharacterized protein n=1 Tax=Paracidovorax konjaci TaxID=32040 RepID=A0A1I1XS03_9BURK|nr:hypothetical protein [Paracidovorax konjaci]SFE10074.1 hypothetical protein SAMN04489710_11480 [Paracidovorax konjaci]